MEIVNKPFTMTEYNKSQFDKYLRRVEELKNEVQDFSYHGRVPSRCYVKLEEITLDLLKKAYGNNHT